MSNENLSYLISSSKTYFLPSHLPYPLFISIAEIRVHLTFTGFVYYNSVCVPLLLTCKAFADGKKLSSNRHHGVRLHVLLINPH